MTNFCYRNGLVRSKSHDNYKKWNVNSSSSNSYLKIENKTSERMSKQMLKFFLIFKFYFFSFFDQTSSSSQHTTKKDEYSASNQSLVEKWTIFSEGNFAKRRMSAVCLCITL